jgi:SOS response associated peptidase (SRAP)
MPGVFPDYPAPVVRNADTGRELTMMRWGMPPPPRAGGYPVTNIRNTSSPHWRAWFKPESRCLVPANSFAEYAPEPNPETKKKDVVWFALHDDRPLAAFAGIWTEFKADRGTKSKPVLSPLAAVTFSNKKPKSVTKIRKCGGLAQLARGPALRLNGANEGQLAWMDGSYEQSLCSILSRADTWLGAHASQCGGYRCGSRHNAHNAVRGFTPERLRCRDESVGHNKRLS